MTKKKKQIPKNPEIYTAVPKDVIGRVIAATRSTLDATDLPHHDDAEEDERLFDRLFHTTTAELVLKEMANGTEFDVGAMRSLSCGLIQDNVPDHALILEVRITDDGIFFAVNLDRRVAPTLRVVQ